MQTGKFYSFTVSVFIVNTWEKVVFDGKFTILLLNETKPCEQFSIAVAISPFFFEENSGSSMSNCQVSPEAQVM